MPSAWTEHLSSFRASHPSKTMKECMIEASACYRKPSSASSSKAAKKSAPKVPPKAAPKTVPKAAPSSSSNPWIAHVQAYRATHACSYAEAMQGAKKTYRALTSNACPSKRSTSLRAVGKSRYRASISTGDTYTKESVQLERKSIEKTIQKYKPGKGFVDAQVTMYKFQDKTNGSTVKVDGEYDLEPEKAEKLATALMNSGWETDGTVFTKDEITAILDEYVHTYYLGFTLGTMNIRFMSIDTGTWPELDARLAKYIHDQGWEKVE